MSAHLSTETLERYCRRLLSPSELLDADDHFAACATYRRSATEAYPAGNILMVLRFDLQRAASFDFAHLSDEQMVAFIDHELDAAERSIVERHLTVCASCADETDDLRAFRETLTRARHTRDGNTDFVGEDSRLRLSSRRLVPFAFGGYSRKRRVARVCHPHAALRLAIDARPAHGDGDFASSRR